MPAGRYDIICDQGADLKRTLTFLDGNGVPVDLTGYTAKLQVRDAYGSNTLYLDLNTTNGGIVLGGAAGTIQIIATAAQTGGVVVPNSGAVPPNLFAYYDLIITSAAGVVTRVVDGQWIFTRRVSL